MSGNKKAPVKTEAAGLALDRCKKDILIITFAQDLTKRKIKTALSLVVERFLVVEMRRIELLRVCSPVNKKSQFSRGLRDRLFGLSARYGLILPQILPKSQIDNFGSSLLISVYKVTVSLESRH